MPKRQKNAMHMRRSEHSASAGGFKGAAKEKHATLPFDCCALSLQVRPVHTNTHATQPLFTNHSQFVSCSLCTRPFYGARARARCL
jgi:hypothetical protein